MLRPPELRGGDDDLARQRRKREARLLDRRLIDFPDLTIADVVADVLAASERTPDTFDTPGYLLSAGFGWQTIEAVVSYLDRQYTPDMQAKRLPTL
jgi:hypothetical protein